MQPMSDNRADKGNHATDTAATVMDKLKGVRKLVVADEAVITL